MPKSAKEVGAGLKNKRFQLRENDHTFYHLYVNGKKTIVFTKISHGEKEIGDRLLALMARQVKLNRKQFADLIECPLSYDDYVKHLRNEGHVPRPEPPPPA